MDLSIVIVSWNVRKLLKKCLESIFKNQGDLKLAVIVVDNASSDGTTEMVKNEFPQVALIANQTNLGFAAANNEGIKESQGDYILILNPDTEILKDTLPKTLAFARNLPRPGIVGVRHLNPDLTLQPSVRRFPTFWPLFLTASKLTKIFPQLPALNYYLAKDFAYEKKQIVDQVAGSFMLLARPLLEQIGLFDENFFLWFEEVDLCRRAKTAGWPVWYLAETAIIHHGGQSFGQQLTLKKQKMFFQSAWRYLKKHNFNKSDKAH